MEYLQVFRGGVRPQLAQDHRILVLQRNDGHRPDDRRSADRADGGLSLRARALLADSFVARSIAYLLVRGASRASDSAKIALVGPAGLIAHAPSVVIPT